MVQEGLGPCLFGGFLHFDQIFNSDSATSSPCCSEPSRDNNHWSSQACVRSSTPGWDVKIVVIWQVIMMMMITWVSPQSVVALQASPSSSDKFLWEEVRTFDPLRRRMVFSQMYEWLLLDNTIENLGWTSKLVIRKDTDARVRTWGKERCDDQMLFICLCNCNRL